MAIMNRGKTRENDLGFGTKISSTSRLINADGSFNIERKGIQFKDLYMDLLYMGWWKFVLFLFAGYVLQNIIFAFFFLLAGVENIGVTGSDNLFNDFLQAFFFSIQTFTTVGYGNLNPTSILAEIIASIDAFIGLMWAAVAAGLFFARFASPGQTIRFADKAVIGEVDGKPSLMIRVANSLENKIIDLHANVFVTWINKEDGAQKRRFSQLPLEMNQIFMLALNWTIVHTIDEKSPFFKKCDTDIETNKLEVVVMIKGFDETYARTVSVNASYTCDEILWSQRYLPMYSEENGKVILDLHKLSHTEPI